MLGPGLLQRVAEFGSLREAAAVMNVDEKQAWSYLIAASNLSDVPIVRVANENLMPTMHGRGLLGHPDALAGAFQAFLDTTVGGAFRQFNQRHQFLQRLDARTSARNQFYCRVHSISRERINAVVTLDLGGGDRLTAHITTRSAEALGLVGGRACHALIDPAWVEVRPDTPSETKRQDNCLRGRVVRCLDDPVDTEVAIALSGGRIAVASMTRAELRDKKLQVGTPACVVIQSSQIILAVDAAPRPNA